MAWHRGIGSDTRGPQTARHVPPLDRAGQISTAVQGDALPYGAITWHQPDGYQARFEGAGLRSFVCRAWTEPLDGDSRRPDQVRSHGCRATLMAHADTRLVARVAYSDRHRHGPRLTPTEPKSCGRTSIAQLGRTGLQGIRRLRRFGDERGRLQRDDPDLHIHLLRVCRHSKLERSVASGPDFCSND